MCKWRHLLMFVTSKVQRSFMFVNKTKLNMTCVSSHLCLGSPVRSGKRSSGYKGFISLEEMNLSRQKQNYRFYLFDKSWYFPVKHVILRVSGFRQEYFLSFPYKCQILCKICDPGAIPFFCTKDIIWTNLLEVHQMMLHTTYQGSRPRDFNTNIISKAFILRIYFSWFDLVDWNHLNNYRRGL